MSASTVAARSMLPSENCDRLKTVVGRSLLEVERIFSVDVESFIDDGLRAPATFFRRNSGPTRFVFSGGVSLAFGEFADELSIVLLPSWFEPDTYQRIHRLSESNDDLTTLLGQNCRDVRIWIYRDDVEATAARECAISFLVAGSELFYATWLHGDLDADYLLTGEEVARDRVTACYSVARATVLTPEEVRGD